MIFQKSSVQKLIDAYKKALSKEKMDELWSLDMERAVQSIYNGILSCVDDELYLQEFLPFGSLYRIAGEFGVQLRKRNMPIEKVMQVHILLRDAFWEYRKASADREHDFAIEKRLCQCFDSLLQATIQAYQKKEPVGDILDPLRDSATGVFNDLYFMTRLEEEIKRSERYLREVSIVLFHVDSVFDPNSSEEDELMRAIARVLRKNTRASDILARIEQSKFAILMPETRGEDAGVASSRLKEKVCEYLTRLGGSFAEVNVEVGIASYPKDGEEVEALLEEASENIRREGTSG